MALFLVQHGLSEAKNIDPTRGLTSQGVAEAKLISEVADNYGVKVANIVHSGKKRAEQTAAIYQLALSPTTPAKAIPGLDPLDEIEPFARSIEADSDLMVVGHLPFLQRLLSFLTTGSEDIQVYQFQNSGIVCLDCNKETDGSLNWFIKWTLNPNIC